MTDYALLSHPALMNLGWALIHFLWQGALIASALEIMLAWAGTRNARLRYFLCGAALAAMPACLAFTFWHLNHEMPIPASPPEIVSAEKTSPSASPVASHRSDPESTPLTGFPSDPISTWDGNRLMPLIAFVWLAGVVLLSGRKAGGMYLVWRWRRSGIASPDEAMTALFHHACRQIGIVPRRVNLKISNLVCAPMTMGWLRPIVLFPGCLISGLSAWEIEMLLAHELAHIRRHDYLVNILQGAVETLFFYHPLTWWISRRMRQERENCCDDIVARNSGDPLTYARTLLHLEELHSPDATLVPAANGGVLRQRIERLIGDPAPGTASATSVLLMLLLILGAVITMSSLRAQNGTPEKPATAMTATEAKAKGIDALVNGKPIFWSDLLVRGNFNEPFLKSKFSGNILKQKLAEARWFECEEAIGRELYIQDAEALGYHVPQKALEDRVNFGVKGFGGNKAAFVENLEKNGLSLEKFNKRNWEDLMYDYIFELKVYIPTKKYLEGIPVSGSSSTKQARQKLFTAESTKLDNDLLNSLRSKAIIQRFYSLYPPAMTAEEAKQKKIVAIVDGHAITLDELNKASQSTEKSLRANDEGEDLKAKLGGIRKVALDALVDRWLMIEDFKKLGGFIPKSYIDDRINDIIASDYGGDRANFLRTIAERGQSVETYRREIEGNAIVTYMRNKIVVDRVEDYYQTHLDLFPADEQVNVTVMEIQGSKPVPPGQTTSFSSETDPQAGVARQALSQMKVGADVSALVVAGSVDERIIGKPRWIAKNSTTGLPGYWPFNWADIEKLKPGQTTDVIVRDFAHVQDDGPSQNRHCYWILRVNERRLPKVAATPATTAQAKARIEAQTKSLQDAWLGPLRAQAQIQVFDAPAAGDL